MANRWKGEVAVKLEDEVEVGSAKVKELTFRLGINEMLSLQADWGMTDDDQKFLNALDGDSSLKRFRTKVLWALKRAHPEITEEQVGEIITSLGVERVKSALAEAVAWALPAKQVTPALAAGARGKGAAASPGALPS